MRRAGLSLLLLVACRPAVGASPPPAACDGTIADAAWLRGAWRDHGGKAEEHWISAAGGTMLGVGRVVAEGRTLSFEFMRIEARTDGLVFIGQPSGGPGVEFTATACAPGLLRFENPGHDWPQVIEYRRVGADGLTATVMGPGRDGGSVGHSFEFRREAP